MFGFLAVCALTVLYALYARRLASTILTAPILFIFVGAISSTLGIIPAELGEALLHPIAEITLVILLFLDAAQTDLTALRKKHVWPVRMLTIGLPLSIMFGILAGLILLPGWSVLAVALAAAIMAPTDAALGQAVVTNPEVPIRPRRALTVESGLNDGLALPAVLLFAVLAAAMPDGNDTNWVVFGLMQIVLGPFVGAAVGYIGGWAFVRAKRLGTSSDTYEGVGVLALAGVAYLGAIAVGGNGFIAAFVAGLAFGNQVKTSCEFVFEFTESEGQLLTWAAFFLLGVALVPDAIAHLTPNMLGLIAVSLFVVRPLAIWISLIGTDASPITRLFFGWFGPRGLATALFALLVLKHIPHALGEEVLHLAINTVWISAVLHGITAAPASRWYGKKTREMGTCAETEVIEISAIPITTYKADDLGENADE